MASELDVPPALHVGATLRAALQSRLAKARMAAVDLTQPDAVHDFRKAVKRLRALLRLIEPTFAGPASDLRAAMGDLARQLGQTRDVQAALDAVEDLAAAKLVSPPLHATLRGRLEKSRQDAEDVMRHANLGPRLTEGFDRADTTIAGWGIEELSFSDLADGLAKTYRRARRARPADWAAADPDILHRLRRRVIEHRYQVVLVKPLWPELCKLWVDEAQALRDELGAHHDLTGLTALTCPGEPLARWQKPLAAPIAERQRQHAAAAHYRSARLFAGSPKAFRRRIETLWRAARETA